MFPAHNLLHFQILLTFDILHAHVDRSCYFFFLVPNVCVSFLRFYVGCDADVWCQGPCQMGFSLGNTCFLLNFTVY